MRSIISLSALLALAACGAGSQDNASVDETSQQVAVATPATLVQPGLWRMQVQMQVDAGTEIKSSESSYTVAGETQRGDLTANTVCLTPAEAAQPFRSFWFPGKSTDGSQCNYDKLSVANGRISGTYVCAQSGEDSQYAVDGRYSRVEYEIVTKGQARGTSTSGDGFSLTLPMVFRTTSRRIGECTGNEKIPSKSPPPPPPPPPGARDGAG